MLFDKIINNSFAKKVIAWRFKNCRNQAKIADKMATIQNDQI